MKSVLSFLFSPLVFMFHLYRDGFKSMSKMNRSLWIIAIVKLLIMFAFLKTFFFKKHLDQYDTVEQKIEHVSKKLTTLNND